jgi:hypothetical protein
MKIVLEIPADTRQTIRQMGEAGKLLSAAVSRGLHTGVALAASKISSDYLSGQSLKSRTGNLRKAVQGWMDSDFDGVVGVAPASAVSKYAWLLGDETKVIRPTKSKFLAIPIGEALMGSGAVKAEYLGGPRSVPDGFFLKTNGQLLFGRKNGKKGKFRALFAMKKEVTVIASEALLDGVTESLDNITESMNKEIEKTGI